MFKNKIMKKINLSEKEFFDRRALRLSRYFKEYDFEIKKVLKNPLLVDDKDFISNLIKLGSKIDRFNKTTFRLNKKKNNN
jgi:hypothetical protein